MASSSFSSQEKHEVFLSFRGQDTRDGFTSFLYEALCRKQIPTYMDDQQLKRGDEISPTLLRAIEESKISVIIFSKNYAASTWCLKELVKILECNKRKGQFVIPVFYRINPSVVRNQTKSYAVAFAKLEERFRNEVEMVNQWRDALKEVTGLCGLDTKHYRPDNVLVQKIVEDILSQLSKCQTSDDLFKGLVGVREQVKKIELLLGLGSTDVQIVGIWGMGGIGKTTLASILFHKLRDRFEGGFVYLNVREESARHGLDHLRKKLLKELFKDGAILSLDTPFVVPTYIRNKFRRKKVLIVLDDVDNAMDFETLIQEYDELAPGSRIIVTSRDVNVFKNVTNKIYKVEGLDTSRSLELFQLQAFRDKSPTTDFKMLSEEVANYADGNPLALRVLGAFLHSRSIEEWESALKKLELVPDKNILKVLRISYEGLDDVERDIFLDIACFFTPLFQKFKRDEIESIVDKSFAKIGISVLNDKSLVTIGCRSQTISMHNLVQQMGKAIVCDEHKDPGNRSRLWIPKDISHVLETASGTETIKSISLHLCDIEKDVKVSPAALSKMSNLQYFQISSHDGAKYRLHLPDHEHELESYTSNKLRFFSWQFYPSKSFPSGIIQENLVQLNLGNSQLVEFWKEDEPAPQLEKLKVIILHDSKNLTTVPNLSRAINIEAICLARCPSLVQVPSYFKILHKLQFLSFDDCPNLNIDLDGISGKNLRDLLLGGTLLEAVPSSIGYNFSSLVQLDLRDCKRLRNLPNSICKLKSLESLDLSGCLNLENFPEILEPMECLECIRLKGTEIKQLPDSSIQNLTKLYELDLNIGFFINDLCRLRGIHSLDLQSCSQLQILPPLPHSLVKLDVRFCDNLESIPELPPLLTFLDARYCDKLTSIQELPPFLTILDASYCNSLETISSWRTPLKHKSNFFSGCSYRFDDCQKLDQNTRSNVVPHAYSLEIFSAARSSRELEYDEGLSTLFSYPGNDVPECFISLDQTLGGTSIIIADLHPNWCDANFLGFAFCFVINLSEFACKRLDHAKIECDFNFKDDCDVEYPYNVPVKWNFPCGNLNSDHLLMLYDCALSYKMLQENFGANWSSICSGIVTSACFDFWLRLYYDGDSEYSGFQEKDGSSLEGCNRCHKIITKCGVWFLYEDNGQEQLKMNVEEPEEEESKCVAQVLSQAVSRGSSHGVVCFDKEKALNSNTGENQSNPESSSKRVRLL